MPLSAEVDELIAQAGVLAREDGFVLVGVFINPKQGEMGVFSSENFPTGQSIGFLKNSAEMMIKQAIEEANKPKVVIH